MFKSTRSLEDLIHYKKFKAKAKYVLKLAKFNYWKEYCHKLNYSSNISKVWSTIKHFSRVDNINSMSILKNNNVYFITDLDKANALALEFKSISSNDNLNSNILKARISTTINTLKCLPILKAKNNDCKRLNVNFTMIELLEVLDASNSISSPGDDQVTYSMLHNLPVSGKDYLLKLYNISWNTGCIPNTWKFSIIKPILKGNNNPTKIDSYRPISFTSTLGKILEKMVANRLNWYLNKNKLINPNQSGFTKFRSCLDNAIRLKKDIETAFNNGDSCIAIFLDFRRAFDLVWIEGLLLKLAKLNINGNIALFIKNFHKNRSSVVKVGNCEIE